MSERRDSNSRPSRWQRDALPAELLSQIFLKVDKNYIDNLLLVIVSINVVLSLIYF